MEKYVKHWKNSKLAEYGMNVTLCKVTITSI